MPLYAHTPGPSGEWHALADHLTAVAELAAANASAFDAADLAWMAGIYHDAGKCSAEFQDYLQKCHREPERKHKTVDHKGAGTKRISEILAPLSVVIQGHHGGLPGRETLGTRLKEMDRPDRAEQIERALNAFDQLGLQIDGSALAPPPFATRSPRAGEFFLRMLFSALVDADHLDTERARDPDSAARRGHVPTLVELWDRFMESHRELENGVSANGVAGSTVNAVRREVYEACLAGATLRPGFFRLTVPTGGGKTRSSLAFGLRHALHHGMRRIITAVPYLSITDQTADVFTRALRTERAVLEHHSAAGTTEDELGAQTPDELWRRLTTQDWDAPVIVTTTVQLFESLLGRSTSSCRKLHRIARSVIILDEAQTVPAHLRGPIFDVLRELVDNYGVTVVLCTATQPALDTLEQDPATAVHPLELAPDPPRLFRALERVIYQWPGDGEQWTWERAAQELRTDEQSLAVVNTIADAQALLDALDDDGAFHLSTLMCGAHRRDVLETIRARLREGRPCRLVSTQVIEAGVDISFPLVLRAVGPLDRIVQAAGRCNREGELPEKGRVVVFDPVEGKMPRGAYRAGTGETRILLARGCLDLNDPDTFLAYFRALYSNLNADREGIQPLREALEYESVAEKFKLINEDTVSILVSYAGIPEQDLDQRGKREQTVKQLARDLRWATTSGLPGAGRSILRRAQPYFVSVRHHALERYMSEGTVRELVPDTWEWLGAYDERRGIKEGQLDPALLYLG